MTAPAPPPPEPVRPHSVGRTCGPSRCPRRTGRRSGRRAGWSSVATVAAPALDHASAGPASSHQGCLTAAGRMAASVEREPPVRSPRQVPRDPVPVAWEDQFAELLPAGWLQAKPVVSPPAPRPGERPQQLSRPLPQPWRPLPRLVDELPLAHARWPRPPRERPARLPGRPFPSLRQPRSPRRPHAPCAPPRLEHQPQPEPRLEP